MWIIHLNINILFRQNNMHVDISSCCKLEAININKQVSTVLIFLNTFNFKRKTALIQYLRGLNNFKEGGLHNTMLNNISCSLQKMSHIWKVCSREILIKSFLLYRAGWKHLHGSLILVTALYLICLWIHPGSIWITKPFLQRTKDFKYKFYFVKFLKIHKHIFPICHSWLFFLSQGAFWLSLISIL